MNDCPVCSVRTATTWGVRTFSLTRPDCAEWFLTACVRDGESTAAFLARLAAALRSLDGAQVVDLRLFGLDNPGGRSRGELELAFGAVDWPVTWLDEGADVRPPHGGALLHAIAGPPVRRLKLDGRTVGTAFEDGATRFCVLGDLRADDTTAPRPDQARHLFESLPSLLGQVGMDFSHVARTWFWNDHILQWYPEFNRVRTDFFRRHGVFDRFLPASTGIGGSNAAGAALTAAVLAIDSSDPAVRVESVPSPMQCPAFQYGSAFSRAVEMALPGHRRLTISGTASIDYDGKTAHVGDVAAQIDLTMRVIRALLVSRGMDWGDVNRGLVYLKRAEFAPAFAAYRAAHGLEDLPAVVTRMEVCRPDLLFEMELDALKADD